MQFYSKKLMQGGAPYEPGTAVYFAEGGAPVTLKLVKGIYFIEAVGGGGGASYSKVGSGMGSGGGSGGCIRGYYRLAKGVYNLTSGRRGDDSNMTNIPNYEQSPSGEMSSVHTADGTAVCIGYGGTGAKRASPQGYGGSTYTNPTYQDGALVTNLGGNNGGVGSLWTAAKGGASVYNGYGKGGDGNAPNQGTNGFLKITYLRRN